MSSQLWEVLPMPPGGGRGEGKGGFDAAGEVLMHAAMGWGKK
jgi:hypothetical protein